MSKKNKRIFRGKVKPIIDVPYLLSIQKDSYERFLQMDVDPSERKDIGLQKVLKGFFPKKDSHHKYKLEFVEYRIGVPRYTDREAKHKGVTYAAPLRVLLKLTSYDIGENAKYSLYVYPVQIKNLKKKIKEVLSELDIENNLIDELIKSKEPYILLDNEEKSRCEEVAKQLKVIGCEVEVVPSNIKDIKEKEVYLTDIPLMTDRGTFIINGVERVVVSQLHRSPGVYFYENSAQIIPYDGSWIEFTKNAKGAVVVSLDRKNKFPITYLLRAFGYETNTDILRFLIDKEPQKIGKISDPEKIKDILRGKILAEDVLDDNGEEIEGMRAGEEINDAMISVLMDLGKIEDIKFYDIDNINYKQVIKETLNQDRTDSINDVWKTGVKEIIRRGYKPVIDKCKGDTDNIIEKFDNEIGKPICKIVMDRMRRIVVNEDSEDDNRIKVRVSFAGDPEYVYRDIDKKSLEKAWNDIKDEIRYALTLKEESDVYKYVEKCGLIDYENIILEKLYKELIKNKGIVNFTPGSISFSLMCNDLKKEQYASSYERSMRYIIDSYFNKEKYNIGYVGRKKIDDVFYKDDDKKRKRYSEGDKGKYGLTKDDMLKTIKTFVYRIVGDVKEVSDIDHLGNRRVRRVGELLENQFAVAMYKTERYIKEKMMMKSLDEESSPDDFINVKAISSTIMSFFSTSQLSQFMEQTNPLSELTHKRRISALGPGGLTRETAGFEVRDVHYSHYGRICPIETPEGPNIGLITSLTTYAKIDDMGFITTPYRKVINGKPATDKKDVVYLTATEEDKYTIAQANAQIDEKTGKFKDKQVLCRRRGEFPYEKPENIQFMDVSPKQIVSAAASLIPFLEHDDANRALMGSNMQRQAVPLLRPESPVVGTGMEEKIAKDSGAVVLARNDGEVVYVDANKIVIKPKDVDEGDEDNYDVYDLIIFERTNQNTTILQRPIVKKGDKVKRGYIIADGPATDNGELALGSNVLVAFLPWYGYNFEDAIVVSERLVKKDKFTSIHIEEYEVEVRETKLGPEELTREIPNVSEQLTKNLDEDGIIKIGTWVKTDDILVGKVSPKGETELTPEEKLLRAVFRKKAEDVKDTSLRVPSGVEGIVVDVRVLSRDKKDIDEKEIEKRKKVYKNKMKDAQRNLRDRLIELMVGKKLNADVRDRESGRKILSAGKKITEDDIKKLVRHTDPVLPPEFIDNWEEVQDEFKRYRRELKKIEDDKTVALDKIKRPDELPSGVIKIVKVFIATERNLAIGDKMAGRHGNKGVIARVVPEEDMPYLEDGTPVDIVLNPLGVPSRMNVGQILETHLGWAAQALGFKVATPVFEGMTIDEILDMQREAKKEGKLPYIDENGKVTLYDGITGDPFAEKVTVGVMYMMKLHHMVDDKLHARATGPYSLITQQPLGGKAQFGGQRFGEMEVWALEAYGAAYTLQEILTVKSDDVEGRSRLFEAIVKGENLPEPGLPESFRVLEHELKGLCLDVKRGSLDDNTSVGASRKGRKKRR